MKLYMMNTKTRVNTAKVFTGQVYEYTDGQALILFRVERTGAVIAVANHSDFATAVADYELGSRHDFIQDTGLGHIDRGTVTVQGIIIKGELKGNPDSKYSSVPLHVFK